MSSRNDNVALATRLATSFLTLIAMGAVAACQSDSSPDSSADSGEFPEANPSDFDSKADGIDIALPETALKMIGSAKTRVYVQISKLQRGSLQTALVDAAKRGVDVRAYMVVPRPAHPETVLASEGLEASGVDITVDRKARLAGFLLVVDGNMFTKTGVVDTKSMVSAAAKKFLDTVVEPSDSADAVPATGAQRLMTMPAARGASLVAIVDKASSSIDLEIYQLQSPAMFDALSAAAARGVAVRVMLEPKTVGSQNFEPAKKRLVAACVTVKETPPEFNSHRNVDHAKFMIVDGKELVFGSGNMVRSGLGGNPAPEFNNRDFWIRDTDRATVSAAAAIFRADFERSNSNRIDFGKLIVTPDNANEQISSLVAGARRRVLVFNQSLNDQALIDELIAAKKRGAQIRVLLGMQPGFGGKPAANQRAIDALNAAGIDAQFFTKHYLHGKVVVADDAAFMGSQNFTSGGLRNNRELGALISSSAIVTSLADLFEDDAKHPAP
jgi:cardiolipin synthase A/B